MRPFPNYAHVFTVNLALLPRALSASVAVVVLLSAPFGLWCWTSLAARKLMVHVRHLSRPSPPFWPFPFPVMVTTDTPQNPSTCAPAATVPGASGAKAARSAVGTGSFITRCGNIQRQNFVAVQHDTSIARHFRQGGGGAQVSRCIGRV